MLGCAYVVFQGGTKSTRNYWNFLEMAANRSYCNWKIPNNVPNSCCIFFCICTAVNLIEEVTLVCCCLLYTNNTHLHLWLLMVRISIWIVGNFHINNQYVVFIRNLNKILSITQTQESSAILPLNILCIQIEWNAEPFERFVVSIVFHLTNSWCMQTTH